MMLRTMLHSHLTDCRGGRLAVFWPIVAILQLFWLAVMIGDVEGDFFRYSLSSIFVTSILKTARLGWTALSSV